LSPAQFLDRPFEEGEATPAVYERAESEENVLIPAEGQDLQVKDVLDERGECEDGDGEDQTDPEPPAEIRHHHFVVAGALASRIVMGGLSPRALLVAAVTGVIHTR